MNNNFVCVSIPVHNGARYLDDSIKSVLNQTHKNIKLIISDNFSTDRTKDIADYYLKIDRRVKYYRTKKKLSINDSFDYAFDLRDQGANYFMWLASDDVLEAKCIENLLKEEKEIHGLVGPTISHIDSAGKKISYIGNDIQFSFLTKNSLFRRLKYFLTPDNLGKSNLFLGLWRMDMLNDYYSMVQPRCKFSDSLLVWNVLSNFRAKSVKNAILYKRIHAKSTTSTEQGIKYKNKFLYYKDCFLINYSLDGVPFFLKASSLPYKLILVALIPFKAFFSYISKKSYFKN